MKRWHLPVLVLSLMLIFRFGTDTRVLSASEIDALVAGSELKSVLESGGSLASAFSTHPDHPRAKKLRQQRGGKVQDRVKRANLLTPPLARWLVGGTMMLTGGDALSASRWAASLAMALAIALCVFFLMEGRLRWWFLALCTVVPSSWVFGSSVGVSAISCLTITLFLIALKAMRGGRSPLWVGAALGLNMAMHPATVWFLIPVFIIGAMTYSAQGPRELSPRAGRTTLPTVPLTLFVVPVVAVLVLTLCWPTLWKGTMTGVFFWITESWREVAHGQVVVGTSFEQVSNRAPLAWTALLQWSALLPASLLLLWAGGVFRGIGDKSKESWDAILITLTLLLAGAINGGLFGGRLSLFALLLIPTLLTATRGLILLEDWLGRKERFSSTQVKVVMTVLVIGSAVVQGVSGTTNLGASNGLDTDTPVPYALLGEVLEADQGGEGPVPVMLVGGDTLSKRGQERWKHAFWTLSRRTALDVSIRSSKEARWLLVIDADPIDIPDEAVYLIPDGEPTFTHVVAGVRWDAYRL